ncbi:MAG: DUF4080 domain-containing protein [Hylemonella sp.]|nr:DUF4080 domain-containing protein [Hylemonella sp.]
MARHGGEDLRARSQLREFTIARPAQEIADELLALNPAIIGFGVYIWNVSQTAAVMRLLKAARPDVKVVLGGPEVSHETDQQEVVTLADHVITGWGDVSFPKLCQALLHGPRPLMKVIAGEQPALDDIALPYAEYSDADLAHRLLYVEASRGCPFKCEFCLSSLDKTAWAFELDALMAELDSLYRRGARHFKFVDRTFNLKVENSLRILQFFLDRIGPDLFLHFEVVPDHLPDRLKAMIERFPAGVLQFEVGIQSFDVEVQQRISRRQDNDRTEANLRWLLQHSSAHLHADLIFGLPGETLAGFAAGFDRLYAIGPHEIQLGILKRLRGTPIARHTAGHGMVYDPEPPYTVRQTAAVDADTMQRFARLARYWDLVANSGRFGRTLALLLQGPSAFAAFLAFSDWLWLRHGETARLTPEHLVDGLHDYLIHERQCDAAAVQILLRDDYVDSGARARPASLRALLPPQGAPVARAARARAERQARHGAAQSKIQT